MILDNRGITIREVADDVVISFGSCQAIFTDLLAMKRAAAKIVPKLLNFEQKQRRMDIAQETIQICSKGHNWWRIMDVWLRHWNQSPIMPMEATRRAKAEKSKSSSAKCEDFAHYFFRLQWLDASWILATRSYCQYYYSIAPIASSNCQKRTELWKKQSWILHYDNAPADTSMLGREVFAKTVITVLGPRWLFPLSILKKPMKEKRFATIENIKEKSQQRLLAIPKSSFQKCFEDCEKCWRKCIRSEGVILKGTREVFVFQ